MPQSELGHPFLIMSNFFVVHQTFGKIRNRMIYSVFTKLHENSTNPMSLASMANLNYFWKSGAIRTGSLISMALILLKPFSVSSDQTKLTFFANKCVSGLATSKKFWQNFLKVFSHTKKSLKLFPSLWCRESLIGLTLPWPITWPR